MSENISLIPTITAEGLQAVFNSNHNGLEATISHIALGDNAYSVPVNDDGLASQTALRNEQQRVEVASGQRVSPQQINMNFIAEGEGSYWVRELGFYLADGTLFAVWSNADKALAWKSDSVPLIAGLELVLTALPAESVTVQHTDADLQLIMTREIAALSEGIIRLQQHQFKQQLDLKSMQKIQSAIGEDADLIRVLNSLESRLNSLETRFNDWKTDIFTSNDAGTNFAHGSRKIIDLQHLSTSLFYPVILRGNGSHVNEYQITRGYSEPGDQLAGLFLKFSFVGDTWGGNPISLMLDRSQQTYLVTAGALGYANYYNAIVFLRGGYRYNLISNNKDQQFTVYETQTMYYEHHSNPQYNSTTGPVSEAVATDSAGGLGMGSIFNAQHDKHLPNLGG